ncbi:CRISPR-associated protein Csx3 [Candidatus Parabeggiatoa sp. HSG14]|uniref:CRISPR-associated protein Csx3 n=1 Tax=Candidatus Parabeggiatoa sp. HSG14 TaxID=3055593 RepID=UPI0025A8EB7C|nr:CRISPR-associated protein Csx3 [Thiotrichales bacterium HSG14]
MTTYYIDVVNSSELKIGFGNPAQNDQLVKDAEQRLDQLVANQEITGGDIIKINGPASLPVAMVLAHKLGHLYQAVACYDPKLAKYVVAIAHGDVYSVGELID